MAEQRTQAEPNTSHKGVRALVCAAAIVIVIAGLKAAASFLLPIIFALFLSLLCIPPMRRLCKMGLPDWLALVVVMLIATIFVGIVSVVVGKSAAKFKGNVDEYAAKLDIIVIDSTDWLQSVGVDVEPEEITEKINSRAIMDLAAKVAGALVSVLSDFFLVILTMIFMLFEASGFPRKLRLALGDEDADLSQWALVSERIQKYLAIKAWVSLATAALVIIMCLVLGVDFPILWGLLAFLFNFVPNIGSIIAAIPACLLALVQLGAGSMLALAVGYAIINIVIGNFIEPKLMGRRLGLSTLVVFLSLLFWGWIWGPLGMLLSVPLTVILKIALEHSADFRWLAILLGPSDDEPHPCLPKAAGVMSLTPPPE